MTYDGGQAQEQEVQELHADQSVGTSERRRLGTEARTKSGVQTRLYHFYNNHFGRIHWRKAPGHQIYAEQQAGREEEKRQNVA